MILEEIKESLLNRFGIDFSVCGGKSSEGYSYIEIRPDDIELARGFKIRAEIRWRIIVAEFVPENYAAPLIEEMGRADDSKKCSFLAFARAAQNDGLKLRISVNGNSVEPEIISTLSDGWSDFRFTLEKLGIHAEEPERPDVQRLIKLLINHAIGLAISLLPIEESLDYKKVANAGLPEGAIIREEVNRYERSNINREACIAHHGSFCHVCGLEISDRYGEIGEGYIHVHHILPVSSIGENYIIDPLNDLIPVCPNCHAMLHRKSPPLKIEELKRILIKNRGPQGI